MTILNAVVGVALTVIVALLIYVLARGRRTPRLRYDFDDIPAVDDIMPTLSGLTRGAVYPGNRAKILQDGGLFPALLDDIAGARHSVHFETFVWSKGELERRFTDALSAKAREGVAVRLLIDALGSHKADKAKLAALRRSGARVAAYCPLKLKNLARFNHRTHRKVFIVDGRIGYCFGHGIADQWFEGGTVDDYWRDTAIRLEGPAVHALQAVFAENWTEETLELLTGAASFPDLDAIGDIKAHVTSSSSGDALSAVSILYTLAIAAARREVLIQNPYFVPDLDVVDLLAKKVEQGVSVQLMVPGKRTDSPFVRRASCYLYRPLLEAGVRLYEFKPTLCHQKIIVIDEQWSHIGSTNFDARSLELNEEVSVGVLDEGIALELKTAFQEDLKQCRELALEQWRKRPYYQQLFDRGAYLIHEQL